MTTHEIQLREIFVYPEFNGHQNVLRKVFWSIKFMRDGVESVATGESILDVSNLQNFVSIDQLTDAQILEWAITTEGGSAFVEQLQSRHEEFLDYHLLSLGTVSYVRLNFKQPA